MILIQYFHIIYQCYFIILYNNYYINKLISRTVLYLITKITFEIIYYKLLLYHNLLFHYILLYRKKQYELKFNMNLLKGNQFTHR